jgi:hypothetical protein
MPEIYVIEVGATETAKIAAENAAAEALAAKNIDGGDARSVYLDNQIYDGGNANG